MGWDHTFDSYVALPLSEFSLNRSRREQIWIVEQDGKIVGSVAIVEHSDKQAQLRWLLLDPAVRGRGLGRHLVEEAMSFCRASGYSSVFLWTVASLEAAIRLYESAGFRKTEETTHAIWGGIVTEAKYELDLI